ncbi:MAG: peptidoglycan DD-metalloendopeptidase family protein [Patescibacteria group bacterium]|nr:peptidoglycan DD-metalloendopeptidase family protein [Patescibacteria group bacterium]
MKNIKRYQNIALIITISFICASLLMSHGFSVALAADEDVAKEEEQKEEALDDLDDELEKLEKKEKKYRDIINLKQKEQDVINAQVKKLENENYKIEKDIEANKEEIDSLKSDIDRAKKEIQQKEDHISLQKKVLEQFIREKYQSYSEGTQHFTLLDLANTNQLAHKDNIAHATNRVGDYVKTIHEEQGILKAERDEFQEKANRIEDAKYELEQRSEHLESSQNYKRVLASQVNVEEDKYQTKLSKVLEEQLSIQQEISSLATNQLGTFSLADLPSKSEADFDHPVKKPYIKTQGYGQTSFSSHYKGGMHNGVDFVAQGSQSIIAPAKGKVKATGNMGRYGYGNWVVLDHGNGLITLYGHMSSVKVSRGDKLKQGDKIGTMGNTGFSTGPHLHFSVFASSTFAVVESSSVDGVYIPTGATVNPEMYL